MSGPIDNLVTTKSAYDSKYWPSWAPHVIYNTTTSFVQSTHALRSPAVVRNPRRQDGTRAMSAWQKQWFRAITPVYDWSVRNKPTHDSWCWDFRSFPVIHALPPSSHTGLYWEYVRDWYPFTPVLEVYSDAVARTNVLNKVAQKKWDLGVTALELRQTAGLVTDLATGIVHKVGELTNLRRNMREKLNRFFRDVRRHDDFYKAASNVGLKDLSLLEDIRNRWMQYQFGIRPLIQDVDNAVNWLSDSVLRDGRSVLVKAKAGHRSMNDYLLPWAVGTPYSGMQTRLQLRETCTTHFSVVYQIPTGGVSNITALGLDNPYSIAWEVTRLSWMCDYVVGVGDWLQSFTAANGMEFREGSKSVLRRLISTGIHSKAVNDLRPDGPAMFDKDPPTRGLYLERGDFRRELLPVHGVVPAIVPPIRSKLGLVQLANSLFAMSSVLGGSPGLR